MPADDVLRAPQDPSKLRVVAIGASAGGLDALERVFKPMPLDTGAVFVVIQHLSPDHKSMMNTLLARYTAMPVVTVEDDVPLKPNTVYLIPPGSMMHLEGNHLRLTPKNPRGLTLPIDVFFHSMAQEFGSKAIAVIVSGTGSDGTRGASAIHEAGGLVLAQDPETAKFDGMPRSVIATGLVDAVVAIDEMAARIAQFLKGVSVALLGPNSEDDEKALPATGDPLNDILAILHHASGINFSEYKLGTIMRRIERRMAIRQVEDLARYLDVLSRDRREAQMLGRELLISVTHFFRDSEAFQSLKTKVVEPLVNARSSGDTIRVWCAGTSTGEEAYSIAMMFLEAFEEAKRWPNLKIFATDVDANCIDTAGAGIYPESISAEISQNQLERFFSHKGDRLQVKNELRQCIVFARHNLLTDPPFTRMDLVVCRNTLIYFKPEAQERVMRRLQYALSPNGYLFLGSSESLGSLHTDFRPVQARHKLWQIIRASQGMLMPTGQRMTLATNLARRASRQELTLGTLTPLDTAKQALLTAFAPPPALLMSQDHQVLHFFGDVQRYLTLRAGQASFDLGRLLPEPVQAVAAALLFRVTRENQQTTAEPMRLRVDPAGRNGEPQDRLVRLTAIPLEVEENLRYTLLVFEDVGTPSGSSTALTIDVGRETGQRIEALESELAAVRETLQATIEALETANEELQATNEELMASNEELQSSNEELQSVNEELNTVNAEYQEKIEIMNKALADLDNMSKVAASGTIFVDEQLNITRFSHEAKNIFRLRDADLGRSISDLNHALNYPDFIKDMHDTIDSGMSLEKHVQGLAGEFYLVKMLPYRIPSTASVGLVVNFIDTTSIRRADRLQAIIDALVEHIAVLTMDGTIEMVNEAWRAFARENGDPDLRHSGPGTNYLNVCRVVPGSDDSDYANRAAIGLRAVMLGQKPQFSMEYPCHSPTEKRWFLMHVRRLAGDEGGVVVGHVNITAWHGDALSSGSRLAVND